MEDINSVIDEKLSIFKNKQEKDPKGGSEKDSWVNMKGLRKFRSEQLKKTNLRSGEHYDDGKHSIVEY